MPLNTLQLVLVTHLMTTRPTLGSHLATYLRPQRSVALACKLNGRGGRGGRGAIFSGRGRSGGNRGGARSKKRSATQAAEKAAKAAEKAQLAAFLLPSC